MPGREFSVVVAELVGSVVLLTLSCNDLAPELSFMMMATQVSDGSIPTNLIGHKIKPDSQHNAVAANLVPCLLTLFLLHRLRNI